MEQKGRVTVNVKLSEMRLYFGGRKKLLQLTTAYTLCTLMQCDRPADCPELGPIFSHRTPGSTKVLSSGWSQTVLAADCGRMASY